MSTLKDKISKDALQKQAGEETYQSGRHYFLADRVKIVKFTTEEIQARVFDERIHLVQVLASETEDNGIELVCDCGQNGRSFCKHKVAAGLAIIARTDGVPVANLASLQQKRQAAAQSNADQASTATPIFAQRAARANVRRLKPWESFVEKISANRENGEALFVPVFYLEARHNQWVLHAKKARYRKDGELGKVTDLAETDAENLSLNEKEKFALSYIAARSESVLRSVYQSRSAPTAGYFRPGAESGMLFDMLRHSRIFLDKTLNTYNKSVRFSPEKGRVRFRLVLNGGEVECKPFLLWAGVEEAVADHLYFLSANPIWILRENTLICIESPADPQPFLPFLEKNFALNIPKQDVSAFLQKLTSHADFARDIELDERLEVVDVIEEAVPRLYLKEQAGNLLIELRFGYGAHEFQGKTATEFGYKADRSRNRVLRIHRDVEMERECESLLRQTGAVAVKSGTFSTKPEETVAWLLDQANRLTEVGFELYGVEAVESFKVRRSMPKINIEVSSKIDWFDLKLMVDFDGIQVSLKELKKAISAGNPYLQLSDGSTARIPDTWLQKFKHLMQLGEADEENVKLSRAHVTLIDALSEQADEVHTDPDYRTFLRQLNDFQGIKEVPVPAALNGTLRPYQKTGFHWLKFLQDYRFGGCLADDMGLGKTVQTLTLLLSEKEKGVDKPTLIVSPKSVIFNWEQEIAKFAPQLRALRHEGLERKRDTADFADVDVVLTTYGILRRDITFLKERPFHYVILDESQYIKNPTSLTARATRMLHSEYRLVLTGTPIENNTLELWSQMAFLNPGMLGSQRYFQTAFVTPIEKHSDDATAGFLQKLIFPFVLRRKKEQVEKDLPPKTESIFYAKMLPGQEKLYTYWRDYYRASILNAIETDGLARSRIAVLEGLTKLRQIACHPMLIDPDQERSSGKYEAFIEQLDEIVAEGHKVLVFSQFVKMLTILRQHFDKTNTQYEYLDGSTQNREKHVRNFQENKDIKLFLISLRAGGTGLNLTAADYVIHYDPWWNPAVEMQATDRSHRIGQEKHVFVYKFITKDSVEEKVLELQRRKQQLADNLISTERAFFKQLTKEDIQSLFR